MTTTSRCSPAASPSSLSSPVPGDDRADHPLRSGRRPGRGRPPDRGARPGCCRRSPAADRRPADRSAEQRRRTRLRSGRLAAGRAVVGSSGTGNLIKAVNLAYDEEETRGFLKAEGPRAGPDPRRHRLRPGHPHPGRRRPPVLDALQLASSARILAQVVRWALLVGPGRRRARRRLPGRPRPRRTPLSLGQPGRAGRGRTVDRRQRRRSASTSTTSAATTRPTARWPASWC